MAAGLTGSDAVFLAMGSVGLQAGLQRIVIQARRESVFTEPEWLALAGFLAGCAGNRLELPAGHFRALSAH